jgi:glycerol-3-phosphate acyltransferase PlsY
VPPVVAFAFQRAGAGAGSGGAGGAGQPLESLRWLAIPAAFLAGSVPFSNIAARTRGVDLRRVGSGTVSGTGLYEVAGFKALAAAGVLEVAKGAVGPVLAGRDNPTRRALAAAAGVSGHNWSPWLGGAGGRGISPALGALLATAPAGAVTLLTGLAGGRLAGETAIGSLLADAALVPVVRRAHGRDAARVAAGVLAPMIIKRLAGNGPAPHRRPATYLRRLVLDRDTAAPAGFVAGAAGRLPT